MRNKVTLSVQERALVGRSYGREVYRTWFAGKVDVSRKFTIVFPKQVEMISSSFVQGFFEEIVEAIGVKGVEDRLVVEGKEWLKRSIVRDLL